MKLEAGASGLAAVTVAIASAGSKYKIALPFKYMDYWGEQIVYDGAKARVVRTQRHPGKDSS
jgi:hypothetical protein